MTSIVQRISGLLILLLFAGCAAQPGQDYGLDSKKLSNLRATLWTDPLGCDHWIADDLSEGYLTTRLNRDGTPRCSGKVDRRVLDTFPRLQLEMGIWTDPRGCQHWVRDDGAEGFMSQRLDRAGNPVCSGTATPEASRTINLAADALFDTDKFALRPEAVSELSEFGRRLSQLGKRNVYIVGHTDARASKQYNQTLSERRAASVAAFLETNFGIMAQTEGRGELEPVATNETPEGRQANRRVSISILD